MIFKNSFIYILNIQYIFIISISKVTSNCPTYSMYFKDEDYWENKYLNYEFGPRNPVVAINNYKDRLIQDRKPFSSACAQCAICLTIAESLQNLFNILYSKYPPSNIKNFREFNCRIRKFCDTEFKNYDFREGNNDSRYLLKESKNTKHVHTAEDGLWPLKLKETCNKYLDAAGEFDLYRRWYEVSFSSNIDMSSILCRSYGIFQHCRNILDDSYVTRNLKSSNNMIFIY